MQDIYGLKKFLFGKHVKYEINHALSNYMSGLEFHRSRFLKSFFDAYNTYNQSSSYVTDDFSVCPSVIKTTERKFKVACIIKPLYMTANQFLYACDKESWFKYIDLEMFVKAHEEDSQCELISLYADHKIEPEYFITPGIDSVYYSVVPEISQAKIQLDEIGNLVISFNYCYDILIHKVSKQKIRRAKRKNCG